MFFFFLNRFENFYKIYWKAIVMECFLLTVTGLNQHYNKKGPWQVFHHEFRERLQRSYSIEELWKTVSEIKRSSQ